MKHLIVGPDNHGVTAYALSLAQATGADVIREDTFTDQPLPDEPIHVTFTDHLFGSTPQEAVDKLLARVGERELSVSFHDIPQVEEGTDRFARRADAYRRLHARAQLTGTNSAHEAQFFDGDAAVIHLPVPVIASAFDPEPGTVGVLGFVYPGKGHEDLVAALPDKRLRFLGSVSAGHEKWAQELVRTAGKVELTGWLDDAAMAREMGRIEVPVCAHRHFSASGSLMTWLGAGRNVLATDSDYTREIDAWLPGRITLVADGAWREAVEALEPKVMDPPEYGWADVARGWEDAWRSTGLL
ncbi:hypothetical protein CGLAUT_09695 [Corynebacterium glaucum]|uniref:glycosyltransferase family 1 protein n=1 Tax=Corynebacterium glaucum TaxID=187491 RepID=UPI0025B2E004|nr:glycosyltransferase family 1 protein [Corynebacterium glaucum]WJZ08412.1 hypothetical protein CGLAUT_09695 [Corynebacterium glaucum]